MKPVHVHEDAELHRELLSLACRSLDRRGRPDRASGSISVRSGEAVIITTGDLNEESLQQDAVMVAPSQGLPLLGETDWPPPETPAHLALHRRLPGRGAVVHVHEPRPHPADLRRPLRSEAQTTCATLGDSRCHGIQCTAQQ